MTADIIAIPVHNPRGRQVKKRLDDMRQVPYVDQPPAVTRPGETWHLNGFNMSQVIIIRDGPDDKGRSYTDGRHQVTVGDFATVRDAAAAVQCKAIVDKIIAERDTWLNADHDAFAIAVNDILMEYER